MKFLYCAYLLCLIFINCIPYNNAKAKSKNIIDNITDLKDFKKLLRTKTNVLVCFSRSLKESAHVIGIFKEVAEDIRGEGTMVLVDCSGEAKKMCKKLKIHPTPTILKHYKDGDFNKDYDRKETVSSMLNFMRDPTGDIPWEEDSTAADVLHIADAVNLARIIRKEQKPLMIMFYAPWCGFCKTLKPEYAAAAKELKGDSILAAIDVNRPENSVLRSHYNITGFPTMLYYLNGHMKYQYEGENTRAAIMSFMRDPKAPAPKPKDLPWNETRSDVVHLSVDDFDKSLALYSSVLVMFYAPWCGHCKRMKPEYEKAAAVLKQEGVAGILAAVDATKEQTLASRFGVKGYPTVKYFTQGELKFDVDLRESENIITFMKDPKKPTPPPSEIPWADEKSEVVHLDEEKFKPFLKKKKHALVMFYAPWCGYCKKVKPEFIKAAEHFKDDPRTVFAAVDCTKHQSVCTFHEITGYPTIKYFSYFDRILKNYKGGRKAGDFISFMKNPEAAIAAPTAEAKEDDKEAMAEADDSSVYTLNNKNYKTAIGAKQPVLIFFYATSGCPSCKAFKPIYRAVAKELSGKNPIRFAMFDGTDGGDVVDELGISHFPIVKLFVNGRYLRDYKGKRTHEDLKSFCEKWAKEKDEL